MLSADRRIRLCISCGIHWGDYRPGMQMEFGGAREVAAHGLGYGIVCRKCRVFRPVFETRQSDMKTCGKCLSEADEQECKFTEFVSN